MTEYLVHVSVETSGRQTPDRQTKPRPVTPVGRATRSVKRTTDWFHRRTRRVKRRREWYVSRILEVQLFLGLSGGRVVAEVSSGWTDSRGRRVCEGPVRSVSRIETC